MIETPRPSLNVRDAQWLPATPSLPPPAPVLHINDCSAAQLYVFFKTSLQIVSGEIGVSLTFFPPPSPALNSIFLVRVSLLFVFPLHQIPVITTIKVI